MKIEKQQLLEKYPKLFERDTKRQRLFNIEHSDGWLPLLDDLCGAIQYHVDSSQRTNPEYPQVKVLQVKEKFGSLRFYISGTDDYIRGLICMAEKVSARTCEICGAPGLMRENGWMRVRCEPCEQKRIEQMRQNEIA